MKNLLLHILVLLIIFPASQAQEVDESHYSLSFVFADGVNLRSAPSLDSKVIANVDAGTPIRTISNGGRDTVNGKVASWNKIIYQGQIAYVWRPLITHRVQRSGKNPDYYFLLGEGDSTYHSKIKLIYHGKTIQEISFRGIKSVQGVDQYLNRGPMGVPLVDDLLYIHWSAYSCGQMGGNIIFAFDGRRLHYFGEDTGIGDGPYFTSHRLITPADREGQKSVITIVEQEGEQIYSEDGQDDIPKIQYQYNRTIRYRWNGKKLVKI